MILTLLILVSSGPSYGAGPTFKDVPKKHWAYKYIEDMASSGYLNGFTNGTFKPSGNLTLMQALSTLSRLAEPTQIEKANAVEGYSYLFNELKIKEDWEKVGLAIALDKDIITETEVKDAKKKDMLNKPVNRERTSELLAKTMGLENTANKIEIVYVDFKDISKVEAFRRKYIRVLLDVGVLDPNGKGNKDFQPKANLSRAEMATLLDKASSYLKKYPVKSEPEVGPLPVEYEYVTDKIKRITLDAGTMLVIENKRDREKAYRIDNKTSITIDGKKSDVKSLSEGQEVKLKIEKDTINIISIEAFSAEEIIDGVAKYVLNKSNKITLEYKEDKKILTKDYYVDSNTKIYLNNKLGDLKDLKDGDLVKLKVKNKTIIEIEAISKVKKITGVIKEIVPIKEGKETYYLITLEDKDEVSHKFSTNAKTDIYRKDRRVNGQELKVKDEAYIDGDYDLDKDNFIARVVDADVLKRTVNGRVSETVKRLNKNTLVTIENRETRKEESYDLASNAEIIVDGKRASSLPSDPGYYAELDLENDEIIKIYIDSKTAKDSILGKIVDIDRTGRTIYIENNSINYDSLEDNNVVIYTTNNTSFLDKDYTKSKFESLYLGDVIMVEGVYKGRNFEANLVIAR